MGSLDQALERDFASALGADTSIFVGDIGIRDIATGAALRKIELAKRAREISGKDEPENAIERAITELVELVDGHNEAGDSLTHEQKNAVADGLAALVEVNDRLAKGQHESLAIRSLFDAYFAGQEALAETPAGPVLRSVGDDLAIERHFDPEQTRHQYQAALDARRNT